MQKDPRNSELLTQENPETEQNYYPDGEQHHRRHGRKIEKLADEVRILRAVSTVLLVFIAVLCVAIVAVVISSARKKQPEPTVVMAEKGAEMELAKIYESLEGLGSVVYGNSDKRILYTDPTYGELWIPSLDEVEKSPYDASLFKKVNGRMTYGDPSVKTFTGIDVSNFQGEIDWEKVKADGIDFAMIRVGYRGYSKGTVLLDESCEANLRGATKAGLDVGVYFFSQAVNATEAVEEAWALLDAIRDYKITYPVVFDWEIIFGDTARTSDVSVAALSQSAAAFCGVIEDNGYDAMVYFNKRLGLMKYNLADLTDYGFWYAQFNTVPEFYYKFDMWQYSDSGRVDGIEGDVDLNICFTDYADRK